MSDDPLLMFWVQAEKYCLANFPDEIKAVESRTFENMMPERFFDAYLYVVLNSGMKNQVAEKIYERFYKTESLDVVRHPLKKCAIRLALSQYRAWFEALKAAVDRLAYLDSLPMIGPITKYHLARNIGLDYAKPDRHLVKVAEKFGCSSVQAMCEKLAVYSGWRVGTVDVILWRYCNMQGSCSLNHWFGLVGGGMKNE